MSMKTAKPKQLYYVFDERKECALLRDATQIVCVFQLDQPGLGASEKVVPS